MIDPIGIVAIFIMGYFAIYNPPKGIRTHFLEAFIVAVAAWYMNSYMFFVASFLLLLNAFCFKYTGKYIGPYLRSAFK